jgi:2-amino-4-hydroxy-6-hydroxymethyldihydropteridine diphosphokinase
VATVVIALGSNLGDRRYNLLRAIHELRFFVRVVRVSSIHETAPVDAPEGSPPFLNAVLAGYTSLEPLELLGELLSLERRLGRVHRGIRNEPRVIDLDLILHGATRMRTPRLTLPHPRAHLREFVLEPMGEVFGVQPPL